MTEPITLQNAPLNERFAIAPYDFAEQVKALDHPIKADLGTYLGVLIDVDGLHTRGHVYNLTNLVGAHVTTHVTVLERFEAEPALSIEQFRQRFATMARGRAHASGVSLRPVFDTLERLGLSSQEARGAHTWHVGDWVHTSDTDLLGTIPTGTILTPASSHQPVRWGLYTIDQHGTSTPITPIPAVQQAMAITVGRIVAFPDGHDAPEWGPPADAAAAERAIRLFKAQAWRAGVAAKVASNWCTDFEDAMWRCGIYADALMNVAPEGTNIEVGEQVTQIDATSAWPGCRMSEGGWHMEMREDGTWVDNYSSTRNLTDIIYHQGLRWDSVPFPRPVRQGDPLISLKQIASAGVGSTMTSVDRNHLWTKAEDQRWVSSTYGNSASATDFTAFHLYQWRNFIAPTAETPAESATATPESVDPF